MNPILMTLANDNAKALAKIAMEGTPNRTPLNAIGVARIFGAVVAWVAALATPAAEPRVVSDRAAASRSA